MSEYRIVNDDGNITTDAVPDAPRECVQEEPFIIQEPEKSETNNHGENNKTSLSYPTNSRKKIHSTGATNTKSRKKCSNTSTKPTQTCTKVINVLNSSGVHIGAVNNYNLYSNTRKNDQQKENIVRTPAMDKILSSEELVEQQHILFVSTHLGDGWRDVGTLLGYSKGQMDHFFADNRNAGHKEVVYKLLLDWTQVKPNDSKIRVLAGALWDSNQKDVVCRWAKSF